MSFNQDIQLLVDWLAALQFRQQVPFHPATAHFLLPGIDSSALEEALNAIISRHEILRTSFPNVLALPPEESYRISQKLNEKDVLASSLFQQRIVASAELEMSVHDLNLDSHEEAALTRLVQEEASKPFRYDSPPLMRATLFRINKSECLLLVCIHHLVADRWSMGVLHRELSYFYQRFVGGNSSTRLPDLPIQYADFAGWQRQHAASGKFDKLITYWTKQWDEFLPDRFSVADLPFARPAPQIPSFRCGLERSSLDCRLCDAIRSFARNRRITLFMFWYAAWTALFHAYSTKNRIALFTNLANRTQLETEGLIGWISNSVLLGISIPYEFSIGQLLYHVRDVVLAAQSHQALPLGALWGSFLKESRHSNLDVSDWIAFEFINVSEQESRTSVEGLSARPFTVPPSITRTLLQLAVNDSGNLMTIQSTYSMDRFSSRDVGRMIADLTVIARRFIDSPADSVEQIATLIANR